jgi:hypothetical protein
MFRVKIANIEEFRNSRQVWNDLVLTMKRPSVFCTWEWIYTWQKHFGNSYEPVILFILEGDELVGILPLALKKMVVEDGLIPGRVLSFCGSEELCSDHLDILSSENDAESCIRAALDFIVSEYKKWDILYFSHLAEDSNMIEFLRNGLTAVDKDMCEVSIAPYISIRKVFANNFEKYNGSLTRDKRHDLKRRRKVLHDKFGIRNVKGDPITSKEAIRDLFFLHNLRAQSKQMETSFHGEDSIQFHEEVSRLFFRNGWLRLRFLLNREKRIAALYSFAFSNRLFAYQSGLDPEWETRGAGSALLYDLIEEAFKDQMNEFDFLRGGEPYKGTWTKESRTLFNVNIYNFTLWGRFCKSAFRARRVIKTIFGKKV